MYYIVCIIFILFFRPSLLYYLNERQGARVTFKSIYCVSRFYIMRAEREREREILSENARRK